MTAAVFGREYILLSRWKSVSRENRCLEGAQPHGEGRANKVNGRFRELRRCRGLKKVQDGSPCLGENGNHGW